MYVWNTDQAHASTAAWITADAIGTGTALPHCFLICPYFPVIGNDSGKPFSLILVITSVIYNRVNP